MKKYTLNEKEQARRAVIEAFNQGHIVRRAAARQLDISLRQFHKLRRRYSQYGEQGLIDRRRFTKGNFSKPSHLKAQVLGLIRHEYANLGPTSVQRKLAADCGVSIHVTTLRQWMAKAHISTARRGSYQIGDAAKAARAANDTGGSEAPRSQQRARCLPPRLYRERHAVSSLPQAQPDQVVHDPTGHAGPADHQLTKSEPLATIVAQCTAAEGRIPSMAELDDLFAAHGTSAEALDEFVVDLAIELMVKLGRPVTEEEIEAYVDEREPHLQPLLRLIDATREAHAQRYKSRGKRLTIEQRQSILGMLHQGVRGADVAKAFGITQSSLETYRRQLRDMDEDDRRGRFNIMPESTMSTRGAVSKVILHKTSS